MDYKLYLERIKINSLLSPNIECLYRLQLQHLLHIPFENLDIVYRRPIHLNVAAFYHKIVVQRRGGYCYECNGLFYALLKWLGFDARMISCRVFNGKELGAPYDHLAIIVTLHGEEWLVDAGFGDFSITPLRLQCAQPQHDTRHVFAINKQENGTDAPDSYRLSRRKAGKDRLQPIYTFTTGAEELSSFEGMNEWHQSAPQSHFNKQIICTLLTDVGRLSLVNNRFIQTEALEKKEHLVSSVALPDLLVDHFGMARESLDFVAVNALALPKSCG